ncbi:MAG: hydroxymethylbilane synthase [Pseudomonadota bacterium]|nr:hydroxymethylbilane synthase [Pseudomonadota bacterium]
MKTLKLGTRRSKLALVQANLVKKHIEDACHDIQVEIVEFVTTGDRSQAWGNRAKLSGKGDFTKEIEDALLDKSIDLAAHSMKDVPVHLPEGLEIKAVLPRHDPRDVYISNKYDFEKLPAKAAVGTGAIRRVSQLKNMFPDLNIQPIRGNVETRIQKMKDGEFDAIILAKAGLDLLGLQKEIHTVFEPDLMLPALAQGIVGVECRSDDDVALEALSAINHAETWACVTAERSLLEKLGGDCKTPVAGYCQATAGGNLRLIAMVSSMDGQTVFRAREKMPVEDPYTLGQHVADVLIEQGADKVIAECKAALSS